MIRNILCLFILCLGITLSGKSQGKTPYDTLWRRVDRLNDSLGLVRTALDSVGSIYTLARKENNMPQVIKALLYRVRLEETTEEDMGLHSIRLMEAETDSLPEPARSILQSLTAGAYHFYYEQKRYEILSRTPVQGGSDAIDSWSAADFGRRITTLFTASLKDPELLKQTKVDTYQATLDKGNMGNARPTLYDVLANRAIAYFSGDEQDIARPSYTFILDDHAVLAPAGEFMTHPFYTPDSASHYWKALLLYQDLLRFHRGDRAPDAFIDADLNRLQFARQYAVLDDKEAAWRKALDGIISRYPRQQATAQACYLLGDFYYTQVSHDLNAFPVVDSTHQSSLGKALALFERVTKEFPSSLWAPVARRASTWINQSDIDLETEKVVVPGKPFLGFVKYRNVQRVSFRLIRSDATLENALYNLPSDNAPNNRDLALRLRKVPVYRSWTQTLPCPPDHLPHGADIKIDALPPGAYILLASVDGRFGEGAQPLSALPVRVSDIAWISAEASNLYLVNRETGAPLSGARVRVWDLEYQNNRTPGQGLSLYGTYYSDRNGHVKVDRKNGRRSLASRLDVNTGSDSLFLDDPGEYGSDLLQSVTINRPATSSDKPTFLFFTDRGIYRPGQTVYFKAIGLQKKGGDTPTRLYLPQEPVCFYLESRQGQKIDSLLLHPGQFGSVHGSFLLPENGLDGWFRIVAKGTNSGAGFSVEAYKRPRFEVSFHPLAVPARLGDTIHLTGLAMAYAGHEVDGATVRYTVTRTPRFPRRDFDRVFYPRSMPAAVSHGSVQTGANGAFTISFPVMADRSVPRENDPVFDFQVQADITDINGESHSASFTLPVGYKALTLRVAAADGELIRSDSLRTLSIQSFNLSNVPQPLRTTVNIERLQAPDRMIRARYTPKPDQFTMDRETFHRLFPHDAYRDEDHMQSWPVAEEILSKPYVTGTDTPFSLEGKRLPSGVYRIVVTATDPSGLPLREENTITVYDPGALPYPAYEWGMALEKRVSPRDSTRFILGTGADSLFIVTQLIRGNRLHVSHKYLFPSGGWVSLSLHPEEGGIFYGYAFVRDNRVFTHTFQVAPAPDRHRLKIHYTTFRDRLEPGSPETWTLSIRGPGKAAADAEVLASMYDASLDQFRPGTWPPLSERPILEAIRWGSGGFDKIAGKQEELGRLNYYSGYNGIVKTYDDLPSPQTLTVRVRGIALKRMPGMQVDAVGNITVHDELMLPAMSIPADRTMFSPVDEEKAGVRLHGPAGAVPLRKNFNETAFFYPDLRTDSAGDVSFSFTSPEALTTWKFRVLAHTRDLDYGLSEKETTTQKTLMVEPNLPRFFRAGDQVWFNVKVVYNGTTPARTKVTLSLLDAITMQPVDTAFDNLYGSTAVFGHKGGANAAFFLRIPPGFTHPLVYRLTAASDNFSDGEQGSIPVVSRNLLVTESRPIFINGDSTQRVDLAPLGGTPYRLTLEYSSNPTWYVVQAIPTLLEAPHECLDYTFNRYYAGAIGEGVSRAIPAFAQMIDAWKRDTVKSPLEQDAELKSVLLQETPWVLDAAGETAQKQRLASLLDTASLGATQAAALRRLRDGQKPDGAFAWFKDGYDDPYITRYIVTGLGRLRRLGLVTGRDRALLDTLLNQAVVYLDAALRPDTLLGYDDIEYLYARSYFPDRLLTDSAQKIRDRFLRIARKQWLQEAPGGQAMLALALYRSGDSATAHRILASLEETSISQTGRYWKNTDISAQAVLVEAFEEITGDMSIVNQLRTWILTQKETRAWPSDKATADACYALLIDPVGKTTGSPGEKTTDSPGGKATDWLSSTPAVKIQLGDTLVDSRKESSTTGAGYFKRTWDAAEIHPSMGHIQLTPLREKHAVPVAWGGIYYQSFQDIDSIQPSGMMVRKEYYVLSGAEMRRVTAKDTLHVGDRVRVRIVFSSDRDLDYVHLEDLRAGCLEPLSVHSGYGRQGGVRYYQTTLDLSTHWYIDHLQKGAHIVEYDLFVERAGVYGGGIATLECLYAPQFSGYSQGGTLRCRQVGTGG